jgi:transposase InsO family protein
LFKLSRGLTIDRANQVWCADNTYIPLQRGFLYLVAVMDWATRKVLSWRLSNKVDVEFCIAAVEEDSPQGLRARTRIAARTENIANGDMG